MRRLLFASLLTVIATSALAAAAAPAPTPPPAAAPETPPVEPPLPPRPDPFLAPDINYVRVGEVDIGRWQYVNVPVGRAPGQVQVWRIDVFTTPMPTPRGRGAWSVSLYVYDCRSRLYRLDHSELYDATAKSIDAFDGEAGFIRPDPRADEDVRQACGQLSYDGPPLKGLAAVLADAKKAADQ